MNQRRPQTMLPILVLLLALTLPAAAQTQTQATAQSTVQSSIKVMSKGEPLAEVNGKVIMSEEVEKAVGLQLAQLEEQIYELKRQKIEALIVERLLADEAAKRGIPMQSLIDVVVKPKVAPATEQEVEAFYQANKARLSGDETVLKPRIKAYLENQRLMAEREAFIQSLRSQAKVAVYLKTPNFRVDVSTDGAPFRGAATAPVTIIEFSDFHCPFCLNVQTTLNQLLARYGKKIKIVYRNLTIDQLHPGARKAAEAAQCANDQGKFWAYHDKLYAGTSDASLEKLKALAAEVALDVAAFERCMMSGKHQATVEKDLEEGNRLGITGTPAFFINGRVLSGAQPLENFIRIIDEELARVQTK
ncbi:MAG: thioredoxin domain-containing protein [Acidobacteria bacterium]|nr:thioredoxin domain-containing protein [Acidobacteriota bacterium]